MGGLRKRIQMTLQVIGAGFGRTGTSSLKAALEFLGYGPSYHMFEVANKPHHIDLWNQANKSRNIDWQILFEGYKSAVDWPACAFLEELIHIYPTAKVILTYRDPSEWYESACSTIFTAMDTGAQHPDPLARKQIEMIRNLILNGVFTGKYKNKEYAIDTYKKHIERIIRLVSPDRLLKYKVTQGWEPLCHFLDVPIPSIIFPWLNDRHSFNTKTLFNHVVLGSDQANQMKAKVA
ncbi:MAG: sulfotransferase [bacterium]|nr:sulfotransferase [bacterium]